MNLQELLISQPDTGERRSRSSTRWSVRAIDLVVIDSVAALTPKAEIEGEMGDCPYCGRRQALRKLTGSIKKTNTMVIFISHPLKMA